MIPEYTQPLGQLCPQCGELTLVHAGILNLLQSGAFIQYIPQQSHSLPHKVVVNTGPLEWIDQFCNAEALFLRQFCLWHPKLHHLILQLLLQTSGTHLPVQLIKIPPCTYVLANGFVRALLGLAQAQQFCQVFLQIVQNTLTRSGLPALSVDGVDVADQPIQSHHSQLLALGQLLDVAQVGGELGGVVPDEELQNLLHDVGAVDVLAGVLSDPAARVELKQLPVREEEPVEGLLLAVLMGAQIPVNLVDVLLVLELDPELLCQSFDICQEQHLRSVYQLALTLVLHILNSARDELVVEGISQQPLEVGETGFPDGGIEILYLTGRHYLADEFDDDLLEVVALHVVNQRETLRLFGVEVVLQALAQELRVVLVPQSQPALNDGLLSLGTLGDAGCQVADVFLHLIFPPCQQNIAQPNPDACLFAQLQPTLVRIEGVLFLQLVVVLAQQLASQRPVHIAQQRGLALVDLVVEGQELEGPGLLGVDLGVQAGRMPHQVQQPPLAAVLREGGVVKPDERVGRLGDKGRQKLGVLPQNLTPHVEHTAIGPSFRPLCLHLAFGRPIPLDHGVVEQIDEAGVGLRVAPKYLQLVDQLVGDVLQFYQFVDYAVDVLPVPAGNLLYVLAGHLLQGSAVYNKINQLTNMKQVSSVSKVSEEAIRNRKLNLSRNNIGQLKDQPKTVNRLKSNHEGQQLLESTTSQMPVKPKSSMGRRPLSSQKHSETLNSVATTSSAKSEQEVKQIISTIFNHSKKLHDFLAEKGIDHEQAYQRLVGNQLFTLSLVQMASSKNPEEVSKQVERCCIHKLGRMMALEKQVTICDQLENKIEDLINKRIKALSHF